jgi:hypothetical protein
MLGALFCKGEHMSFIEIAGNRNHQGRRADRKTSTMALHKSGARNGAPMYQLSISLSHDLMKNMRWQTGDRIKVLVDDETPNTILLVRAPSGGWALSSPKGGRARIQISSFSGLSISYGERYVCTEFVEAHNGAVLHFIKCDS